jgi:uracil-DNA glycosylase family 4
VRAAPVDGLAGLAGEIAGCRACPELAGGRTMVVPGEFPAGAALLLVGEAPGREEDLSGRPFVGRAGRLLDELLAAAGLGRGDVAIANTVKCRPPGNRAPRRTELARCRSWLDRQVGLADPAVILTLGGTAAAWAFGGPVRLADVRGVPRLIAGRVVMASYHPSAALRFGAAGAPRAALAADVALAAGLAGAAAGGRPVHGLLGPAEAVELFGLTRAAYGTLPRLEPPSGVFRETPERVAADLVTHPGVGVLLERRLIAGLRMAPAGSDLWLRRVAVSPDQMRRGVGSGLVDWVHRWGAARGYTATRLGVRRGLSSNHAFWRRHGYRPVAEHEYWTEYRRPLTPGSSG